MPKIQFDPKDILQINATIIAGILILLTVSSFSIPHKDASGTTYTINQFIVLTILPFAGSSFCAIALSERTQDDSIRIILHVLSKWIMGFGFLYLIILVYIIAFWKN
jgi:hypothetical protein